MENLIKKRKRLAIPESQEGSHYDSRCYKITKYESNRQGTCSSAVVLDPWSTFGNLMPDTLQNFMDYGETCYMFNKSLEEDFAPNNFLGNHSNIDETSWREVITTMIAAHRAFRLDFETLCLAVNYLERFLACTPLKAASLKVIGATCLYLACKVMEKSFPKTDMFLLLFCEDGFTAPLMYYLEKLVLRRLCFRLRAPTIEYFLEHFSLRRVSYKECPAAKINRAANAFTAARGIAALSMTRYGFHSYPPSLLAQCCLRVADQILQYDTWNRVHPRDCSGPLWQECMSKITHLVSSNNILLCKFMPGVFPETFPDLVPPPTKNGSKANT
ncbi:cyclin-O protein B-like [Xenopus laevis]|uniref:Cyclin-O protein B-like n=1 Tax=Xenopus laevis TaxID=8355 RepID=A0A8J1KI99_XENLA|nr:cyclin-O protein B-like [Xenopus laevis]